MANSPLIERFLRYVKIDTQSSETSGKHPSTSRQKNLAKLLVSELKEMGVADVDYDEEHCYVYASIPGNKPMKAIGFIAHMDTSPAVSDTDVKPRFIESYDDSDPYLKTADFPELKKHIGETLIATDTRTLLGADDKAGVAEIMNLVEYYMQHSEVPHRPIAIAFTPDEEIGEGSEFFDLARFHAGEAYTVDGGDFGIVEYENFNAAAATVKIRGKSVHPGSAKNLMINASVVAAEFNALLPADERPETTEMYEGFYMLEKMSGSVEEAELIYIIRDHDREKFEARKAFIESCAATLNERYGEGTVSVELRDQYYNMASIMKDHMELIDRAYTVIRELGDEPQSLPIRGGTDGATLTWRGLPCPNLCTGGYNYHSRYEFASVPEMEKSAKLLIGLARA
ncbi:MAG: peptidase T [Eubacterium sp.]|nr:peptidase T [Eubacterium sp.]